MVLNPMFVFPVNTFQPKMREEVVVFANKPEGAYVGLV